MAHRFDQIAYEPRQLPAQGEPCGGAELGRVIVTGASGFVGRALCERLQAEGRAVTAVMRRPADGPWDSARRVDLGRELIPDALLAGVDTVFHLAGKAHALADSPDAEEDYRRSNVQSTLDLLAAARRCGVRAFIYFSSVKAIAEGPDGTPPDTPYGRSKLAAERAVLEGGDVPHAVVLRPSLVYGPHPKGYLELMIRAIRGGWFPPLPELGNGRSMVHRNDLAEAALLCAQDPRARGRTYVVTDGTGYSTRRIYELILDALGRAPPRWNLPVALLRLAALGGDAIGRLRGRRFSLDSDVIEKLIGSAVYDGLPIRQELGFRPRRSLEDSIREMVDTTGS